ncbi:molybdopterin-binding protein [Methylobacterium sp. JK268]
MTHRRPSALLTPLTEARALLLAGVAPVAPETCAVADAVGSVAAAEVAARAPVPARRIALRDGFAVEAAAIVGASAQGPVKLRPDPAWLEAGDPVPDGADAVLPAEAVAAGEAVADVPPGDGTRPAGGDIPVGHPILRAGMRVTPLGALALAAAGLATVAVRRPRIALLATGTEAPDRLTALLAALLAREGARVAAAPRLPDDPDAIAAALATVSADAVCLIGGSGFGRRDGSAEGLARAGGVGAHGLALRPGDTAGFGTASGRPVLLLPGRPEAALSAHLALGRPLLAALAGADPVAPATGLLRRKIVSCVGLTEIVFVRRAAEGVEPLGGADIPLHRLALADGAVLVPPEHEGYASGTPVEILPL